MPGRIIILYRHVFKPKAFLTESIFVNDPLTHYLK